MTSPTAMESVVLFGDSLTEAAGPGTLTNRVTEYYIRRLDVVNRGYGGYTTEWVLPVFRQIFATRSAREAGHSAPIRLLTIWFGANDSCLPGEAQHVPLETYSANLSRLINLIKSPESDYYSPDTRIVLITPPPCITSKWHRHLDGLRLTRGEEDQVGRPSRDQEVLKTYVDACLRVGEKEGVPTINFHQGLIDAAGGSDDATLDPYLSDGLHLNPNGYEVLFGLLKETVAKHYPELLNERLPMVVPDWREHIKA